MAMAGELTQRGSHVTTTGAINTIVIAALVRSSRCIRLDSSHI